MSRVHPVYKTAIYINFVDYRSDAMFTSSDSPSFVRKVLDCFWFKFTSCTKRNRLRNNLNLLLADVLLSQEIKVKQHILSKDVFD